MKNRQPTPGMEGRMLITPENGATPFYATVAMADYPIEDGDPLSKETFLKDETAAMYGLGVAATPDDLFQKLAMPYGYYGFDVTLELEDGTPIPGAVLNGLQDFKGNTVETDKNGKALGMCESATPTVSVSNYWGVTDLSVVLEAREDIPFTPIVITAEQDESIHLTRTSGTPKIMPGIPLDICLVSGGQSGGTNGSGGRGGGVINKYDIVLDTPDSLTVAIGAAGINPSSSSYTPCDGGESSISVDGVVVLTTDRSTGAAGGAKNQNGSDGTIHVFDDDSLPIPGGGGSGFSDTYNGSAFVPTVAGKDFGARGGYGANSDGVTATGPGGGGGGSGSTQSVVGNGASGALYLRVNFGRRSS